MKNVFLKFVHVSFASILLFGLTALPCQSQSATEEAKEPKQEKIRLVHAEQLTQDVINGITVRRLTGNVRFVQGQATLTCDRAVEYVDEERVVLFGRVKIVDEGKQLTADRINYYESTRKAIAEGRVTFVDSTKTLRSNFLNYDREKEKAFASGNVTLDDNRENTTLSGDSVLYLRDKGYARVMGHPRFVRLDSTESRKLTITGRTMEMFDDGERVKVSQDVTITRGNVVAHSGELEFYRDEEKIILSITPRAKREDDYLTGTNIEMVLKDNEIEKIHVLKNAIITSRVDTLKDGELRYDLLTGEDITVSVRGEQVDTVIVRGRATSYYHLFEDGVEKGLNKVLGDEIRMLFTDGELKRVIVKSDPSTSAGTFYPPKSKAMIEKELDELLAKIGIVNARKDRQPTPEAEQKISSDKS